MNLRKSLAIALLSAFGASAIAQTPATAPTTPRVDTRQDNQARRIDQGQANGQLTARESRRLEREQAGIARAEEKFKSDGSVTAQERRRLHQLQSGASKDIRHQKHDIQRLPPSSPGTGPSTSPGG